MYRQIHPTKLAEKRGNRTRKEIADLTRGVISEQQIGQYEKGRYRPSERALPHLLAALGCDFEDISEPKSLALNG